LNTFENVHLTCTPFRFLNMPVDLLMLRLERHQFGLRGRGYRGSDPMAAWFHVIHNVHCASPLRFCLGPQLLNYPAPDTSGARYCFRAISLFICFFLCFLSARLQNGWTYLHEIFREGAERPDYIFGQFRETARCRCATRGRGLLCFSTTADF